MVMLLSSSSSSLIPRTRTLSSFSSSSSSSSSSSVAVVAFSSASTSRQLSISSCVRIRQLRCAVFCASKVRGMAELVEDKKESTSTELPQSRAFLDARTGEDLLSAIWNAVKEESLPPNVAEGMVELYHNYRNAVLQSGVPKAEEIILYNMALVLDRVFVDVKDPFEFSPHHKGIREPFDYYNFGQQYIRPLVDFRSSYVGNVSVFGEIEEQLKQGDNVVLMSNHQSEADPAVIALLLESKYPYIAENMIYIAGDRVITDPLCKPFSMGRNLLCVYSKKHMNDDPHLVEKKKKANTRSLKEMALLLRGGSKIIWIAPSGGRDRPGPVTKECYPAPFDASSADNMRRLVQHAGVPGHIYPLAILCYDIMPPPPQVEKDIGEKRIISFHGTGISVAPKVDFREVAGALEDPEEAKVAYTKALYDSVSQQYNVLTSAIHGNRGLEASTPSISLSQPWQ